MNSLEYTFLNCLVPLQFLWNLRNLRDSHAAVSVGSESTEPSSVTRIIAECESALTFLNRDLGILSSSVARERGDRTHGHFME